MKRLNKDEKQNNKKKEQKINRRLNNQSKQPLDMIYKSLNTSKNGLSTGEANKRLEIHGKNEISYDQSKPWYIHLLNSFLDPFILILVAIIVLSYFTDVVFAEQGEQSWMTIIIISVMVLISAILQFFQEYTSQVEADNLKDLVPTTTLVKRAALDPEELLMEEVVPGDIVKLAAGDLIPADMRIIECNDLFINQSSMTGEAEPVERFQEASDHSDHHKDVNAAELDNILLMGTIVVSGSATAVVLETGHNTYFGTIADSLSTDVGHTSFEEGVQSVSKLLIQFMIVMVPIVFIVNWITKKDWLQALLFAISIAVGLTPEMLPTLVTTNLARGATSLSKQKIVVKRLSSIQNFGAMDILCTDKTGTLTQDKIILETHLDVKGNVNKRVLVHGFLNSYYQTGLKNLLDVAVIERTEKEGLKEEIKNKYEKVDEIPFDFNRRRMSVVVKSKEKENGDINRQLITKGAVEEMLSICSKVELDGEIVPLSKEIIENVEQIVNRLNSQGMRVIAVAHKNNVPDEETFGVKDEKDMTLIGYMGFLDPPKDSAITAIKALHNNGVDVKILTGDNEVVTRKVAKDVGISTDNAFLGEDMEKMTDKELYDAASKTSIIAKLSPMQKERVINILQSNQHVVGFLGDGINDAQALKQADVGVSVDTAVDIAKESADIILLEKDLNVLEQGVIEGRRVFGNIIKYIKMTASSNFGNVFSVLVASAFLPFLPMMPIQLLTQDLLYSISQIALPWDNMDAEYLKQPQVWNAEEIGRFMIWIGPISSIFDIITYLVMWFIFGANSIENQALFQTGWFVVGLLTQTLIVHMIRTEKVPVLQSRASAPVRIMTVLIMVIGLIIPFTPIGTYLGFVALPKRYFKWLIGILIAYCASTEMMKRIYIKKFNTWI